MVIIFWNRDEFLGSFTHIFQGNFANSNVTTLLSGPLGMHRRAYIIMLVADVLVPKGHQAICNHHADCTMSPRMKHIIMIM